MKAPNRIVIFPFLFQVLFLAPLASQDRYTKIIDRYIDRRTQYESISYTVELKHKIFIEEDTTMRLAKVELVRDQRDTLYGGTFSIVLDTIWYGYDGSKVMKANLNHSALTIGDPVKYLGLFVSSTWVDNLMDYGFLKKSSGIKAYLQDTDINVNYLDTMIGEWPCIGIYFHLPDQDEFQRQTLFIAIDTLEYCARSKMNSIFFQDNEQYTNWYYKDVQYGHKTSIEKLDGTYEATFQHIVQYKEDTSQQYAEDTTKQLERKEFDFALFTGKVYKTNEMFRLPDVKKKFIILDFWYTSCYPCIKSIPALNRIYTDYTNKDVGVYGINMIDDQQKDSSRLERFFKNNPVGYPIIFGSKDLRNSIQIQAFPTLLILDENDQVIYKKEGYSEHIYQDVSDFLEEKL